MHLKEFIACVERYEIPQDSPNGTTPGGFNYDMERFQDGQEARDICVQRGMWCIVTKFFVQSLAGWIGDCKVLEIMAGAGWLAKALRDEGVNIIATDNGDWDKRHTKMKSLTDVMKVEASIAVRQNPDADVLLVCWPPYGEQAVVRACQAWGSYRPIIYIGENDGGCNAPEEFFENFQPIRNQLNISIMSWPGIHDQIFFGYWEGEK